MSISAISGSFGSIDPSRFMSRMSCVQNVDTATFATKMLEKLDTDGDGSLSIEETDLSEDMFASFDTDGDGLSAAA